METGVEKEKGVEISGFFRTGQGSGTVLAAMARAEKASGGRRPIGNKRTIQPSPG